MQAGFTSDPMHNDDPALPSLTSKTLLKAPYSLGLNHLQVFVAASTDYQFESGPAVGWQLASKSPHLSEIPCETKREFL